MAKTISKAQKGKKLTVARTREVADSLKKVGYNKLASATFSKLATKSERDSLAKYGFKDVENAERYKKLADDAERKSSVKKQKSGGKIMIKRADGSYSQRGLWDNLRSKAAQNKKTGAKPKAPTKAMLTQEKKIKAKGK